MHSTSLVQDVRGTVAAFYARCNIPYKVVPFDDVLYQESVDEAIHRGYLMDGTPSLRTYLREGVIIAATAYAHLLHRPTQIWIALFTSCILFVDDAMTRFPLERTNVYQFNQRFLRGQAQGNGVLDAFADLLHQVPELFNPRASDLIVSSILNYVTAHILEHETKDMQISSAAQQYATYQRMMGAGPEAYVLFAFPREIPVKDYIQALPEIMSFYCNANDVLSFYKEELAGETTNQISIVAACNRTSKLVALNALAETTANNYESAVEILKEFPEAYETFKNYAIGYVDFHTSAERYRLAELQ